jgi:hypothetical protein
MGVSGHCHAPAALLPPGKGLPVPIVQDQGSNPDRPVVQPVVRHYTAWANPAPHISNILWKYSSAPGYMLPHVYIYILFKNAVSGVAHYKPSNGIINDWVVNDMKEAVVA